MSHAVFTVVTTVRPEKVDTLRDILAEIRHDPANNALLPFRRLETVHFASFTIFPDPDRGTLLVFENNVDGSADAYLNAVAREGLDGLTRIYECCTEQPSGADSNAMAAYLKRHRRTPHLYHVGTPYRSARNIRADKDLRRFLDRRADSVLPDPAESAASVWQKLREAAAVPAHPPAGAVAVVDDATGRVAWESRPEPRRWSRFVNWTILAVLLAAAVGFVAWLSAMNWSSQGRLTLALVTLFAGLGVWTSILIGWPANTEWRHPLNIVIWFGGFGWATSLIPEAARLTRLDHVGAWTVRTFPFLAIPWLEPIVLALFSVVVLSQLIGTWTLPTPDLAHPTPSNEALATLQAQEDLDVNNHMSAMVLVRPGLYRRLSLYLLLWTLKYTWFRTVLRDVMKGRLFKFSTVHFAQWTVIDDTRYLFLSNYDHSWSRYLDDFGYITFGLARLWGQGQHSPGLSSLEHFKDFSRTWMVPYSVWYRAYPDTSVTQVWNNEKIRLGLLKGGDETASREWLGRLVASEEH